MTRTLKFLRHVIERRPASVSILLSLITLWLDFAVGREIRFPLFYILPIGMTAWLGKKTMAYALAIVLPMVRVAFENSWHIPESIQMEGINAFFEALALCLYVFLIGRQAGNTRHMKSTITAQGEDMQQLRAFTRTIGTSLQGRAISPGLADGVALLHLPEPYAAVGEEHISPQDVASETDRFDRAVAASVRELNDLRERLEIERLDEDLALVEVRVAMLTDRSLARECKRRISADLVKAENAVAAEIERMQQMFQGLKQEFMRARIADLRDIGSQILRKLGTAEGEIPHRLASLPPGTVVVTRELLLSDALQMDPVNVVAVVTEKTGPASHVAMLARARGIPAVSDIKDATGLIVSGDHLLVDADEGTVTMAPTSVQAARFALRKSESAPIGRSPTREAVLPCVTRDGAEIRLHANIGRPDEAVLVLENRFDGVGLFRSEYLFLHAERPPDIEAQTTAYGEVAAMLAPLPVVIRTMDLGGDKMPRFGTAASELAVRSGLRGLAYSLAEITMFRTQVTAIIRAAQRGNVSMMFPMVMGVADLREARALVDDLLRREAPEKRLPVGAMIETPAAAFDIHGILKIVDFVSIGTNDLSHSILAMDRGSEGKVGVSSFLHPSVLRATHQVVQAAVKRAVSVSVCGEAASDPAAACLLIGMGVRDLSINPFLVARLRHTIRQVTIGQVQSVAKDVLDATTGKEVKAILAAMLREIAH